MPYHFVCSGDPEGGTCKNAARNHELHSVSGRTLPSSHHFYNFLEANLKAPDKDLILKAGRGIYRRSPRLSLTLTLTPLFTAGSFITSHHPARAP